MGGHDKDAVARGRFPVHVGPREAVYDQDSSEDRGTIEAEHPVRALLEDLASESCDHLDAEPSNECLPCRARWIIDQLANWGSL